MIVADVVVLIYLYCGKIEETVGCQNGDLTKNDSDVYLPLCLSGDSKKWGIRFYKTW